MRRVAIALSLALPTLAAHAFDLDELMALLASRTSGEVRFVEHRFVQGLDQPLVATGTLGFRAPDRLLRRTLEPTPETMEVAGDEVTLTRGGRSRRFRLDTAPEAAGLVEAMRGTLTGNAAALQRHFRAAPAGTAADWSLQLVPLGPQSAGPIDEVVIRGSGADVRTIETRLAGGDRSVLRIEALPAAAAPSR